MSRSLESQSPNELRSNVVVGGGGVSESPEEVEHGDLGASNRQRRRSSVPRRECNKTEKGKGRTASDDL